MCGDHQWEIERGVDKSSVICVVKGFYRNGVYHSCKELPYRMYSFFWTLALPLRKFAFGLHRKLKRKLINRMVSVPSVDFFIYRQIEHSVI